MITESRMDQLQRNMSPSTKRVFDAVPISEPWSASYIMSEMHRLGSSTKDQRVVLWSLNSLKESGLVIEPQKGVFIRRHQVKPDSQDKPKAATNQQPKDEPEMTKTQTPIKPVAEKKQKDANYPLSALSDISVRANKMQAALKELCDEIEIVSVEIVEHMHQRDADAGKLRQLQALLKGLS